MLCSIFMASTTHNSCPDVTDSPGRTDIDITLPGMGDLSIFIESSLSEGGSSESDSIRTLVGGLLVLVRNNRGSISTKKDSPSTITSTSDWFRSPICMEYHSPLTFIRNVVNANPFAPYYGKATVLCVLRLAKDGRVPQMKKIWIYS